MGQGLACGVSSGLEFKILGAKNKEAASSQSNLFCLVRLLAAMLRGEGPTCRLELFPRFLVEDFTRG